MEKQTRNALRSKGVESFVKDSTINKGKFQDTLAEAADDAGHITGSSRAANYLIEKAADIVADSEEKQRKMRRPDLYPDYNRDYGRVKRRRSFSVNTDLFSKNRDPND